MEDPNEEEKPNKRKAVKLPFDTTDLYDFEFTNSLPQKFAQNYYSLNPHVPELTITAGSSKITKVPKVPPRSKALQMSPAPTPINVTRESSVKETTEKLLMEKFRTKVNELWDDTEVDALELFSFPEPNVPPPLPPRTILPESFPAPACIANIMCSGQRSRPNLTKELVMTGDILSQVSSKKDVLYQNHSDYILEGQLQHIPSKSSYNVSLLNSEVPATTASKNSLSPEKNNQILNWMSIGKSISQTIPKDTVVTNERTSSMNTENKSLDVPIAARSSLDIEKTLMTCKSTHVIQGKEPRTETALKIPDALKITNSSPRIQENLTSFGKRIITNCQPEKIILISKAHPKEKDNVDNEISTSLAPLTPFKPERENSTQGFLIRKLPSGVTVNFKSIPQSSFVSLTRSQKGVKESVPLFEIANEPSSRVSHPSKEAMERYSDGSNLEKPQLPPRVSCITFSNPSSDPNQKAFSEDIFSELVSRFESTAILNDINGYDNEEEDLVEDSFPDMPTTDTEIENNVSDNQGLLAPLTMANSQCIFCPEQNPFPPQKSQLNAPKEMVMKCETAFEHKNHVEIAPEEDLSNGTEEFEPKSSLKEDFLKIQSKSSYNSSLLDSEVPTPVPIATKNSLPSETNAQILDWMSDGVSQSIPKDTTTTIDREPSMNNDYKCPEILHTAANNSVEMNKPLMMSKSVLAVQENESTEDAGAHENLNVTKSSLRLLGKSSKSGKKSLKFQPVLISRNSSKDNSENTSLTKLEVDSENSSVQQGLLIRKLPSGLTLNFRSLPQRSFVSLSRLRQGQSNQESIADEYSQRSSMESMEGPVGLNLDKSLLSPKDSSITFSHNSSRDSEQKFNTDIFNELVSRFGNSGLPNDGYGYDKGKANLVIQDSVPDIPTPEEELENKASESQFSLVANKGSLLSNPSLSDDSEDGFSYKTAEMIAAGIESRATQSGSTVSNVRSMHDDAAKVSYDDMTHKMVDLLAKVEKKIEIMDDHLTQMSQKQESKVKPTPILKKQQPKKVNTVAAPSGIEISAKNQESRKEIPENPVQGSSKSFKINKNNNGGKSPGRQIVQKKVNVKPGKENKRLTLQDLAKIPKGRANLRREPTEVHASPNRFQRNFIEENIKRVSRRSNSPNFSFMRNKGYGGSNQYLGLSDRQISEFLLSNFPITTATVSEMVSKPIFANDQEIRQAVRSELAALLGPNHDANILPKKHQSRSFTNREMAFDNSLLKRIENDHNLPPKSTRSAPPRSPYVNR